MPAASPRQTRAHPNVGSCRYVFGATCERPRKGRTGRMRARSRRTVLRPTIVVLEGDQTGQELLVEALRVLGSEVVGFEVDFEKYDLSLENRRATKNAIVHQAAEAMKRTKLGLKAATITPEGHDD